MNIFTAPINAISNFNFYRTVMTLRWSVTFKFIAYLALLSSLGTFFYLDFHLKPQANEMLEWAKDEMPPLIWSPLGIQLQSGDAQYEMFHPDYGAVVTFDMNRDQVTLQDMDKSFLWVTPTKIFYPSPPDDIGFYDLTLDPSQNYQGPAAVAVGPEFLDKVYNALKPWAYIVMVGASFFLFFFGKLFLAFVVTSLGLILNHIRTEKLSYQAIFNVAVFAMSASSILEILGMIFPQISFLSVNVLTHLGLSSIYMFLVFWMTDRREQMEVED